MSLEVAVVVGFSKLVLIFLKDLFIRLQNFPIIWFAEEKDKERIQVFFLFYLYLLFLIASLVISYNTSANSFKCIKVPKTTVAQYMSFYGFNKPYS